MVLESLYGAWPPSSTGRFLASYRGKLRDTSVHLRNLVWRRCSNWLKLHAASAVDVCEGGLPALSARLKGQCRAALNDIGDLPGYPLSLF